MFAALPGDLLFLKIDVRNGAIGLLPDKLGPAVVTSEYLVYTTGPDQVEADYLAPAAGRAVSGVAARRGQRYQWPQARGPRRF